MRAQTRSPFLLLVAAGLLWGTGGVTGRALADSAGLSAIAVAAYRLGLGGFLLVALLLVRRRPLPQGRAAWQRIAATGLLAAAFQGTYFAAVAAGTVSTATFATIGSAPLFVILTQAIRHRRLPSPRVARSVLLGIGGLGLLVASPAAGRSGVAGPACFVLAAISGGSFATFTLLGRRPLPTGLDAPTVTGYGFLFGGSVLAAITSPFAGLTFPASAHNLALVTAFAVFPTALAYTFFFTGLRRSTATAATLVALLEPLTATVLAMAFFGDRMSGVQLFGAVLLLMSVVDGGRVRVRRLPEP